MSLKSPKCKIVDRNYHKDPRSTQVQQKLRCAILVKRHEEMGGQRGPHSLPLSLLILPPRRHMKGPGKNQGTQSDCGRQDLSRDPREAPTARRHKRTKNEKEGEHVDELDRLRESQSCLFIRCIDFIVSDHIPHSTAPPIKGKTCCTEVAACVSMVQVVVEIGLPIVLPSRMGRGRGKKGVNADPLHGEGRSREEIEGNDGHGEVEEVFYWMHAEP
mmetsp:Transcript_32867/g.65086  ORF Transcript_32867/g.65086 Transcript_32867/m.65086 type:complete len:216 (+) Transcript_32867:206-853(+)